ncbi:heavy metal-associated domain-containing protein [Propionimicrobium sp. PCR01-08-3]|uniref:heavy-metal-associated domain-containing protein n=1 Tax=Propionimicrobium sp. PCR01-08-3 TaxID=3052086 RepID=UPI00255CDCB9|nr:heavy metal-associated domain-containing protein [Propionimicrobium sp. PCR01-08-3]WIY82374.1 heavy metal-associated domain-containing protein [Propionimicrobium sp. PCR01-08-3]
MITNYVVTGMTCGHCVNHVTEEVSAIPGVTDVKVEQAGPMAVTSDAAIDLAKVEEAVAEAGDYKVALV